MPAYYNEIDPKAAAWLRELIKQGHIADGVVDERSIVDVTPDDIRGFTQCHFFAGIGVWSYALRSAGWADDRPVWTGSCPCQPFSAAGAGGGFDDERHLWPHWHHLISQCRPPVVLGEQVASKDGLGWLDLVCADMEAAGYAVGAADLCAAGLGAPHIRQRLWFVGLADAASVKRERQPNFGPAGILRANVQSTECGDGFGDLRAISDGLADASGKRLQGAERGGETGTEGRTSGHSAECSSTGGLADAADAGLQIGRGGSDQEPGSVEQSERLCADGGLADAKFIGNRSQVKASDHRKQKTDRPTDQHSGCGSAFDGLADSRGERRDGEQVCLQSGESRQASVEAAGRSGSGGLADAGSGGGAQGIPEPQKRQERITGEHDDGGDQSAWRQAAPVAARTGSTNGFWRDADWLFCRDGKWRPVESGTSPLAHGSAARVGRLRGYGNAIVAPVAQAFIETVMGF